MTFFALLSAVNLGLGVMYHISPLYKSLPPLGRLEFHNFYVIV